MRKIIPIVLLCGFFFLAKSVYAGTSPLSINIIPPVEFPPESYNVAGLRVSVFLGEHRNVYGFDFAAVGNITEQSFAGLAVSGIFNRNLGNTTIIGLQAAGITNISSQKTQIFGLQLAPVNSITAESSIYGVEIGILANLSAHTTIHGAQIGLYNKAIEVYGFQIGLINFVTSLHGLQIGLLNFNEKGVFSVCPILNFGF